MVPQGSNPNHLNRVNYNPYRNRAYETHYKPIKVNHTKHITKNNKKKQKLIYSRDTTPKISRGTFTPKISRGTFTPLRYNLQEGKPSNLDRVNFNTHKAREAEEEHILENI